MHTKHYTPPLSADIFNLTASYNTSASHYKPLMCCLVVTAIARIHMRSVNVYNIITWKLLIRQKRKQATVIFFYFYFSSAGITDLKIFVTFVGPHLTFLYNHHSLYCFLFRFVREQLFTFKSILSESELPAIITILTWL